MDLSQVTQLLFAVAALLAVLIVGFVVVVRPTHRVRLRHKDSEIEIDGAQAARALPKPEERPQAPAVESPDDEDDEAPDPPPEVDEPKLSQAIGLLHEREFEEGLRLVREEAATLDSPEQRRDLLALGLQLAASKGSDEALAELAGLAAAHPNESDLSLWHGIALTELERHEAALGAFRSARDVATSESEQVTALLWESRVLEKMGGDDAWLGVLADGLANVDAPGERARLLTRAAKSLLELGRSFPAFSLYEEALALQPADPELRFQVAYAYSNKGAPAMALFHYRRLIALDGSAHMALNNAGVAAEALDLAVNATAYYQRAEQRGNTLSTANLAHKLLRAGFIEQARDKLQAVVGLPDVHPNVLEALGTLAENERREEEQLEELSREAAEHHTDLKRVALSVLAPDARWTGQFASGDRTCRLKAVDGALAGRISGGAARARKLEGSFLGGVATVDWADEPKDNEGTLLFSLGQQSGHGELLLREDELRMTLRTGDHELEAWRERSVEEVTLYRQ